MEISGFAVRRARFEQQTRWPVAVLSVSRFGTCTQPAEAGPPNDGRNLNISPWRQGAGRMLGRGPP